MKVQKTEKVAAYLWYIYIYIQPENLIKSKLIVITYIVEAKLQRFF